jgi:hypothetical protein
MRLNRNLLILLILTSLTFALTSPAAAGPRDCQKVYATLETGVVDEFVEIGQVEGTLQGSAYLRYADAAPPIDPKFEPANFVIKGKLGTLNLWVYSMAKWEGTDAWWRDFEILRAEGTGMYANRRIVLEIYGLCTAKGGNYEISGTICSPLVLPPKK